MVKNAKLITGIALILIAVAGSVFWETWGRSAVCETRLAAASEGISRGQVLTEENVTVKGIGKDYIIDGAISGDDISSIIGSRAVQYIPAGSQISDRFIAGQDEIVLKEGESIYCIDESMIGMVSSSLRRGDRVRIYGGGGREDLGTFTVAFVKDNADREVKNAADLPNDQPLDRENSNYSISRIEIVCSRDDYAAVCDQVSLSGKGLIIVQEVQ